MLEIDIDIRRLVAFFRDKTFDQCRHAVGIDLRNAKAKTNCGVRCRTSSLAKNILTPGENHDVAHRQEKRFVLKVTNQFELMLDQRKHLLWYAVRPALVHALNTQLPQVSRRRHPVGHQFIRIFVAQFIERKLNRICDA